MEQKPKILVVRFSSLGDVVLTTPVYKNLKNHWKNCRTTALVKEQYSGVLENNPSIDQIMAMSEGESIFSLIKRIRKENFDVLIDLHNNLRSNVISFLSKVPKVVRYQKAALARRLLVSNKIKNPELNKHTLHRYLDTLRKIEIEPVYSAPEIFSKEVTEHAEKALRILIIQTAFLGDAVLTTPLFSALREAFPSCQISVLCTPQIEEIFSGNPHIDQILVMDKRGKEGGILSPFKWSKKLNGRFDVALLPHRSFRSAFTAWLARIPKRIGFNLSEGKFLLTDAVPFDWKSHDSKRNLKLLEALGINALNPKIEIIANAQFNFDLFLTERHISANSILIGVHAGSVWKTKRWLPEYFAELSDRLIHENKSKILFFGSKTDQPIAELIRSNMKNPEGGINLCGQTDLKTLSCLISKCSLFITNDSGPMHLASAAGVPLVAIFGPTTKELGFFPLGDKSIVAELNLPCRPCSLHGGNRCPLEHFKCMRDLTPEIVLKECRKLLAAPF